MRHALINGQVITPYRILPSGGVVMGNGRILSVFEGGLVERADTVTDVHGLYISPGFIDLHTHGGGGFDFMDGTPEAFIGAAKAHMQYGATTLFPTTLTASKDELLQVFASYRKAKAIMTGGPNLPGLHLEGPYLNPAKSGAQDARWLRLPDPEHTAFVTENADCIARVTLAPELPGAKPFADRLRRLHIMTSIGHSAAQYAEVLRACEHGFSMVTHLYSGNSMFTRLNGRRVLGIVESASLIDELTVEIIGDGIHLPPELLKLVLKQKPHDKICLVTDSMRGAGLPEGQAVKLGSLHSGQDVLLEGGVAWLPEKQNFAGSTCTMDRCVRTLVQRAGVAVEDAVRMATLSPARAMRLDQKGVLAEGMDADLCVFNQTIEIQAVYVGGKETWKRTAQ